MLQSLSITNYILIKNLDFEITPNMMVITGETGAGKSIFLHALSLLMGKRLDKDIVGPYGESALIEGIFSFVEHDVIKQKLQEAGFDSDEDMVFARTIDKNGKTTYRINRELVTLNFVRSLLEEEIDLHSQFNTQLLLDQKKHLAILDSMLGDQNLVLQVSDLYKELNKLKKQKEEFLENQLSEIEIEELTSKLNQLKQLNLNKEEAETIANHLMEYKQLEQTLRSFNEVNTVLNELNYEQLYPYLNHSKHQEVDELLNSAYVQLQEAHAQINQILSKEEFDEETYAQLNQRAFTYSNLKRKYQMDVDELLEYIELQQQKIDDQADVEKTLIRFDKRIADQHQLFLEKANQLSAQRKALANSLSQQIIEHGHDLNLNQINFIIDFKEIENQHGIDDVEFLVSMNRGMPLNPLAQVASGGELSRLMLILKVIFNQHQTPRLIVFDEIDTGVSGKVADLMARKMKQLSTHHPLIVVTHLPLVAVYGDVHYNVIKSDESEFSQVDIVKLNENKRVEQLALMLSSEVNEQSLKLASDLVKQTHER